MTVAPSAEIDLVSALVQRWKTLAACALIGIAAGAAYALVAPKWYSATLTVVPSQHSEQAAAATLAARLPIGLDSFGTDVQRIQAVLTSNSVADEVIKKFNLKGRYGKDHIESAREALWSHCGTAVDRKSAVVTLTCEDKDPKEAMDIAAFFGDVGNRVFARVSVSSAREERKFLEQQVIKARNDVDEASRKLREFQEEHKIIDLSEQSRAVISAMATLKGELLSKQLELTYLTRFSASTESSVVQLQQQIAIMQSKLDQLEDSQHLASAATSPGAGSATGSAVGSGSAAFFPGAMSVPELRFQLEQLMREQKIQETVFSLMTQRFEMAKVDEARDTSTFQILDHPTLPTYRSRPKLSRSIILGFVLGIGCAALWIAVPLWWRKHARTDAPA